MVRKSGLKYTLLSILLILASISLTRTTLEIVKRSKRLDEAKSEIATLQEKKTSLEKSIEYKNSDDFIEKTAREELNMALPGEKIYVVKSDGTLEEKEVLDGKVLSYSDDTTEVKLTNSVRKENLKKWWELFF